MEKKYELVKEDTTTVVSEGIKKTLYRIRALRDFGDVKKGDLGGYIEKENNLSHEENCWVYDQAKVYDNARVSKNARIEKGAAIYGDAYIREYARVTDLATVYGSSTVADKAVISDCAKVYDKALILGMANIERDAQIYGNARISGNASIGGTSRVCGLANVDDCTVITGDAVIKGCACVYGKAAIDRGSVISGFIKISSGYFRDASISSSSDCIVLSPSGSEDGILTTFLDKDGNIICDRGCFHGTIEEFKDAVHKTHRNDKYFIKQYMNALSLIKKHFDHAKTNKDSIMMNEYRSS